MKKILLLMSLLILVTGCNQDSSQNKINLFREYEEKIETHNLFMKFAGLEGFNPVIDSSKVNTYCANRIGNDWGKGNRDNRFEPLLEDIKFESKKDCERYISVRRLKVLDMDVWRDNFVGTYIEEKLFNSSGYPACSTATDCWLDKDIYTPEKPIGYDDWKAKQ